MVGFIGSVGLPELLIVGMVVLLLFGNRLPSVMRSLGVGITEFKKGIQGEPDPKDAIEDQRRSEEPVRHVNDEAHV